MVNVSPGSGYVLRRADFRFMPGIHEALRFCVEKGYLLILVTSQQGVGKKQMTLTDLEEIHDAMQAELDKSSAAFHGIYSCTHLDGTCTCRKPSPELILNAIRDHKIRSADSIMIGDHDRDILMARNAGIRTTVRVAGQHQESVPADHRVAGVQELLPLLKKLL